MRNVLSYLSAAVILVVAGVGVVFNVAYANGQDQVCPHGGEWSAHQDPPFFPVDGAVEYCFKGGNENSDCEPYLGPEIPEGDHVCDLSHWSYRLGDPTNEPTPTPEPTPEPTP